MKDHLYKYKIVSIYLVLMKLNICAYETIVGIPIEVMISETATYGRTATRFHVVGQDGTSKE